MTTADDQSVAILGRYVRHQDGGEIKAATREADLQRQLAQAQAECRKARAAADAAARRLASMDAALAQARSDVVRETYKAIREARTANCVRRLGGASSDDAFLPAWVVGRFPFDKPGRHLCEIMPQIMRMLAPLSDFRRRAALDDCGNVGSEGGP